MFFVQRAYPRRGHTDHDAPLNEDRFYKYILTVHFKNVNTDTHVWIQVHLHLYTLRYLKKMFLFNNLNIFNIRGHLK